MMLAPAGSGAQRTAAVPVPVATMTNGGHHRDWQPVAAAAPGLCAHLAKAQAAVHRDRDTASVRLGAERRSSLLSRYF